MIGEGRWALMRENYWGCGRIVATFKDGGKDYVVMNMRVFDHGYRPSHPPQFEVVSVANIQERFMGLTPEEYRAKELEEARG